MPFNNKKNTGTPKRDYTKMKTPHTYAIIFAAIFLCWMLTFLVPAGKFSTHKVEYTDSNGEVKTKTVLMADTFRYSYRLDREAVKDNLAAMSGDEALMESLGVDPGELDAYYAEKIRKNPARSVVYESDAYFRERMDSVSEEEREFGLGHKLILLEMLAVLIWIIWGVTQEGYYIPEIASQFFVMGFAAGVTAVIFKLNDMTVNGMASAFQSGVADLAGTAVVVGMAKGILLVLGGSDANVASTLNTILYTIGNALAGVPSFIGALFMYLFQSCFNLIVTSNSGQAALTMPIMAPLADLVGVTRQVAVLAFQMGAGFVDAFTPVSASLIGVLGVARIDWGKWAKFQIKMQAFFFLMGTAAIAIAIAVNLQ